MGNKSKRSRKLFDVKIMIQQKAEDINRAASWWKKSRYRSILLTAVALGIALAVGLSLVFAKENERKAEQRRIVTEIAAGAADSLWHQLSRSLSSTFALASIIRQHGKIEDFPALAAEMMNTYGGISNLQLQPNGIVRQIYPLAGNEKAIGHNLLQDPKRRTEALAAIESKELTLAGPFTLIQGGVAVIGRLPVFLPEETGKERFWGFTAVLIHLDDLLKAANLDRLITGGYAYEIFRIKPNTGEKDVFARSLPAPGQTAELNILDPVRHLIEVPNAEWTLCIAPIDGWGKGRPFGQELGLIVVVSFGLAWLVFSQLKKSDALAHEIELKTHEITQRQRAEEALQNSQRFLKSTIDSLPATIAILDASATIISINEEWYQFADTNGLEWSDYGIGRNYLEVCESATGEDSEESLKALEGIRMVMTEQRSEFYLEYPCHSPIEKRWFLMFVTRFSKGVSLSVVVTHLNITSRKLAENALRKLNEELEDKVKLRTEELGEANNQLQEEISQCMSYENELKDYQEKLQALNAEMIEIEEGGKRRIAIELHENIGQILAMTNLKLSLLKESANSAGAVSTIDEIHQYIQELIKDSRLLTYDICPPVLYTLGLEQAVSWLTNEMKEKHGLHIEFHNNGQFNTLSDIQQVVVFRAINELLMNIKKHAQVSSARISMVQDSNNLRIDISDEGVGFDDSQLKPMMIKSHRFGLFNICERIRHLGGVIEVNSEIGRGTRVTMLVGLGSEDELNDIHKG